MFAAHHTYHLREGWVYKGLAAVHAAEAAGKTNNVFLLQDAPERFGMGPAMIQAMRFWLQATGLLTEQRPHVESSHRGVRLTEFGKLLWKADPHLEQQGTLSFLHTHLVRNIHFTPTWFWFFNNYLSARSFDEPMCLDALHHWVIASSKEQAVATGSLHKDVACLLRMYDTQQQVSTPEQTIASPFLRLNILTHRQERQKRWYRAEPPNLDHLHPLVLLYILAARQRDKRKGTSLVSFKHAMYEPGNIGRVIPLLTKNNALAVLAHIRDYAPEWTISIERHGAQEYLLLPACSPEHILHRYYQKD